jgi:hypothetical protein
MNSFWTFEVSCGKNGSHSEMRISGCDRDARPMCFWDLWYPSTVGVVAGGGEFEVEVADLGGGGCDCGVAMAEVVD